METQDIVATSTDRKIHLSNRQLTELRSLTAVNAHSEAYLTAARILDLPELATLFQRVCQDQARRGHLTHDMDVTRRIGYEQLMAEGKKLLGEQYHTFYMCF